MVLARRFGRSLAVAAADRIRLMRIIFTPVRIRVAPAVAMIAVLAGPWASSQAQSPGDPERRASATLPQNNEALLMAGRVQDAIEGGDYRLAIQLVEQMTGRADGLVPMPATSTFYPAWRQATRLLERFPAEGVRMIRQLNDAAVQAEFDDARKRGDLKALRELFDLHPLATPRAQIGEELVARLLDQARFVEAVEVLREARAQDPADRTLDRLQLAVALAGVGAFASAGAVLSGLSGAADGPNGGPQAARIEAVRAWIANLENGAGAAGKGALQPRLAGPIAGRTLLEPTGPAAGSADSLELLDALDLLHRVPTLEPVLTDDALLVRTQGRIYAFDPYVFSLRWRVNEIGSAGLPDPTPDALSGGDHDTRLGRTARHVLTHYLSQVVSAAGSRVFSIENLAPSDEDGPFGGLRLRGRPDRDRRNDLVARDLKTGRVLWQVSQSPAHPLRAVAFQDRPWPTEAGLLAAYESEGELYLALLSQEDGTLLRQTLVASKPTHFTADGRCRLVCDDATAFLATGNGVVAAFRRDTLEWRWAATYPSTLAEFLSRFWWQPAATPEDWPLEAPLLAEDLVIVAPVDSSVPEVLAFDRFDGTRRWSLPRRQIRFLVGAYKGGLLVADHRLRCLELQRPDLGQPRWASVPIEITGRPALDRGRVFVPTRRGIVVIDAATGKLLDDQQLAAQQLAAARAAPSGDPAASSAETAQVRTRQDFSVANLVVCDTALVAVSPEELRFFYDPQALRARLDVLQAGKPEDDRLPLLLARADALEGRWEKAIARLEPPGGGPPADAAARRLLQELCLQMAQQASGRDDRLHWLRRVRALAQTPEEAARIAIRLGDELRALDLLDDAIATYGEVLLDAEAPLTGVAGEPDLRRAEWLHAAARLRTCVDALASDASSAAVRRLVVELEKSADSAGLFRLATAVRGSPALADVQAALLRRKLAPELALGLLPEPAAGVAAQGERALLLTRFETHVSLAMLPEAREDRRLWEQLAAGASISEDERHRAALLTRSLEKLEAASGAAYTSSLWRQWRLAPAELILDARDPLHAQRPWLLVRNLEHQSIQLIDTVTNQQPWREHLDGLSQSPPGNLAETVARNRVLPGRSGPGRPQRPAWPALYHEPFAAVPVLGGLLGVGLGPERYAGSRLWEYPVPEWSELPHDFWQTSAADSEGLCFAPRADRLVRLSWFDGRPSWQREFPGSTILRVEQVGGTLAVLTDPTALWLIDAQDGGGARRLEIDPSIVHDVNGTGSTLVVLGGDFVAAFHLPDARELWRRSIPGLAGFQPVAQRDWLALRVLGRSDWELIDVSDGRQVLPGGLGPHDGVTAAAVDGPRLLLGTIESRRGETGAIESVGVSAYGLPDGELLWSARAESQVAINVTQLVTHAGFVPLLLARDDAPAGDDGLPAIQLLDKNLGRLLEPLPIQSEYRSNALGSCAPILWATPSRILVQMGGNLLGFGNSRAAEAGAEAAPSPEPDD